MSAGGSQSMRNEVYRECILTLDRFMAALNAGDAAAMDREMHFPHVRIAEGKVSIYEAPGSNPMDLFDRLKQESSWKYSDWGKRDLIQFNRDKAHFALDYTRYANDDFVIGVYESLYILTKVDGRWGILARSSFGP